MLIDLLMRMTVNPAEYEDTLAVRVYTDNRPENGVFSGRHEGFRPDEEEKPVLRVAVPDPNDGLTKFDDMGIYDFIVDRPEARALEHQISRYRYIVKAAARDIYIDYQDVWLLTLQEHSGGWDVSVGRLGSNGFTLVLPGYVPGWASRNR